MTDADRQHLARIKTLPSRDLVRQLLHYDAETGEFTWPPRPREMFTSDLTFHFWNSQFAGQPAGSHRSGYLIICIQSTRYFAHRVAWLYAHGEPVPTIDHIDGDKLNNRIANLRAATHAQNMANTHRTHNHSIGFKGVSAHRSRFRARIILEGKRVCLGNFATPEEAAKAYREAAISARGEFARWDS